MSQKPRDHHQNTLFQHDSTIRKRHDEDENQDDVTHHHKKQRNHDYDEDDHKMDNHRHTHNRPVQLHHHHRHHQHHKQDLSQEMVDQITSALQAERINNDNMRATATHLNRRAILDEQGYIDTIHHLHDLHRNYLNLSAIPPQHHEQAKAVWDYAFADAINALYATYHEKYPHIICSIFKCPDRHPHEVRQLHKDTPSHKPTAEEITRQIKSALEGEYLPRNQPTSGSYNLVKDGDCLPPEIVKEIFESIIFTTHDLSSVPKEELTHTKRILECARLFALSTVKRRYLWCAPSVMKEVDIMQQYHLRQ